MLPTFIERSFMLAAGAALLLAVIFMPADRSDPPLHPVPAAPVHALPPLAKSDPAVREAIHALRGAQPLESWLAYDHLIHRFVSTVDDLALDTSVATEDMPEAASALRALERIDVKGALMLYARMYPLLQEAYQEAQPGGGYFNDTFVRAIDRLAAAPSPAGVDDARAKANLVEIRRRLALHAPSDRAAR